MYSEAGSLSLGEIARAFRLYGWLGFWLQIGMAFLSAIALLFAISGRTSGPSLSSAEGSSLFWAMAAIIVLVLEILLDVRYIRIARGIQHEPGSHLHPRKKGAISLLRLGFLCGFVGIVFSLLGSSASVWVLLAKTVSQPPGIAITDPDKIVRAMDVFVVLANLALIGAHLIGAVIAFWLLDRVHHYGYSQQHQR